MTVQKDIVPSPTDVSRFLADKTVGRLVKWLRILGYDTAYLPQLSPQGLINEGRRQGRMILTRDTRFLRQKNVPPFIFVRADRFRDQLQQVVVACQLDPTRFLFTRCSECNVLLDVIEKEKVQEQVPPYVGDTQSEFRQCLGCHRVYWGATHKEHVEEELRRMGLCVESS